MLGHAYSVAGCRGGGFPHFTGYANTSFFCHSNSNIIYFTYSKRNTYIDQHWDKDSDKHTISDGVINCDGHTNCQSNRKLDVVSYVFRNSDSDQQSIANPIPLGNKDVNLFTFRDVEQQWHAFHIVNWNNYPYRDKFTYGNKNEDPT